jgi:hypothetical protein
MVVPMGPARPEPRALTMSGISGTNKAGPTPSAKAKALCFGQIDPGGLLSLLHPLRWAASRLRPRPRNAAPPGGMVRSRYDTRMSPGHAHPLSSPQPDACQILVAALDRSLGRYWH